MDTPDKAAESVSSLVTYSLLSSRLIHQICAETPSDRGRRRKELLAKLKFRKFEPVPQT